MIDAVDESDWFEEVQVAADGKIASKSKSKSKNKREKEKEKCTIGDNLRPI